MGKKMKGRMCGQKMNAGECEEVKVYVYDIVENDCYICCCVTKELYQRCTTIEFIKQCARPASRRSVTIQLRKYVK